MGKHRLGHDLIRDLLVHLDLDPVLWRFAARVLGLASGPALTVRPDPMAP
jgi:hypothetical protein